MPRTKGFTGKRWVLFKANFKPKLQTLPSPDHEFTISYYSDPAGFKEIHFRDTGTQQTPVNYSSCFVVHPSGSGLLFLPYVRTRSGKGGFSHHGATLWNKLPTHLKSVETLSSSKSGHKTLLFSKTFGNK